MILDVNTATFEKDVLPADEPVLVDIWAPWCKPCYVMLPVLEKLAQQFSGQVRVVKINADENADLVLRQYKTMGIPTLLYFRYGKLVERQVGVQSEETISQSLSLLLSLSAEKAAEREISTNLFIILFRLLPAWVPWLIGGLIILAVLIVLMCLFFAIR